MSIAACSDPLDVLIIGCGNIAGGFDVVRAPDAAPFTHAGAFRRHGRYRLSACVEPDGVRRSEFMRHWGVPNGYPTINDAVESGFRFDVVSVCSPTDCHANDVRVALRLQPRLIFCEKPVTPSVATTAGLVQACEEAGVLLAVNHTRRWDPEVTRIRSELARGVWGPVRTVVGLYNKGVLNNGSHMIDLLHHLLVRVVPLGVVALQAVRGADLRKARVVRVVPASRVAKDAPELRKIQENLVQGQRGMTGNPKGLQRTSLG